MSSRHPQIVLANFFDANRLDNETANLLAKMAQSQYADGSWPWFPGGPGNDYITLYITTDGPQSSTEIGSAAFGRYDLLARRRAMWRQR